MELRNRHLNEASNNLDTINSKFKSKNGNLEEKHIADIIQELNEVGALGFSFPSRYAPVVGVFFAMLGLFIPAFLTIYQHRDFGGTYYPYISGYYIYTFIIHVFI